MHLPPPLATQVNGSSATMTGKPVWLEIKTSRSLSIAPPPPVSTIPRSLMSALNSGGDASRAVLMACMIDEKVLT